MQIETVVNCKTVLGEGPLWDVAEQKLYWIDSYGQQIFRAAANGSGVEHWTVPQKIGSMALREAGGAVIALATGIYTFDFLSGESRLLADLDRGQPHIRLNDGKVDRDGRFLFGSMDTTEQEPAGILYRLEPDGNATPIDDGITVSNGPCWSPDGSIFYFADSRSRAIWAYDYDRATGSVANKRRFALFAEEDGLPDGATVDVEGYVWSAGVYKGKLLRFKPDGSLDLRIEMPVQCVTSVMFGGPALDTLYVTSMARPPVPDGPQDGPLGGNLFAIHGLGIRGVAERRCST
jgi:L-arabinonolactonase